MKGDPGLILRVEQERFLERLVPPRDSVSAGIEAYAQTHGIPIVDPEIGHFLRFTALAIGARRILELGTSIGYSGLCLARSLPEDGLLVSVDVDPKMHLVASKNWHEAGVLERTELVLGNALDVLRKLSGVFDLLLIDTGCVSEYREYLELALPHLRSGGVVLVDNALWQGQVATEVQGVKGRASAMREFVMAVLQDQRFLATVVPVGDGLLMAMVQSVRMS